MILALEGKLERLSADHRRSDSDPLLKACYAEARAARPVSIQTILLAELNNGKRVRGEP